MLLPPCLKLGLFSLPLFRLVKLTCAKMVNASGSVENRKVTAVVSVTRWWKPT